MNVYTCTDFKGHWPVGTAAVIVAPNKRKAGQILRKELVRIGLIVRDEKITLTRLTTDKCHATILCDGNY